MYTSIFENSLDALGLSQNEKAVYYELLTYGRRPISKIAKGAGIERVTVYAALKKLEERQLVRKREYKGREIYVAESPVIVLELLRKQHTTISGIIGQFQHSLPLLLGKFTGSGRPKIQYFETKEDFIGIFESTLEEAKDEMLFWGSALEFIHFVGLEYERDYITRRVKKGNKMRILLFPNELMQQFQREDREHLRITKFLPEHFQINSSFQVFGQKVVLWNPTTISAILIEDPNIVTLFRTVFEITWEQ